MGSEAPVRLAGQGLVLREWAAGDVAVMSELFDDPEVAYRTPLESPFDLEAARRYLETAENGRRTGERVHLAITTDGGRALGEVLLSRKFGSIGYAVGAAHRGRGLAGRALRVMTEYAHRVAGLPRVVLEIEPENQASAAVARAAGYRLTDDPPTTVTDKGRVYELLTWVHEPAFE